MTIGEERRVDVGRGGQREGGGRPHGEGRAERGRRGMDRGATQVRGTTSSDSYYGRSILKPPVWRGWVPAYFFTGGLAGASSGLALAAVVAKRPKLTRVASWIALGGMAASPPLLIADLGRPERFYNMLRMAKVTSPMSVGTWVVTAAGGAVVTAAVSEFVPLPKPFRTAAHVGAAALGLPLATYTAALLADTAVPVWHEGRRELPLVFAGSAAAAAGGLASALAPADEVGAARVFAVAGAALEVGAGLAMERRLGPLLAEPYRTGRAGALTWGARLAAIGGGGLIGFAGRSRAARVVGGLLAAAGALGERFAVHEAGIASARDPKYVVEPQRARKREGRTGE